MATDNVGHEVLSEHWTWDTSNKSPDVFLSSDRRSAFFHTDPIDHSTGTAGVRGCRGFEEGQHYWEIILLEPATGTSVMFGVGTDRTKLHITNYQYVNLIGLDSESWGLSHKGFAWHGGASKKYCDAFYERGTVIGCDLNLYTGTLKFFRNGTDLGVAFTGLDKAEGPLYPIISSTATESELGLGLRTCSYLSLQDKCCVIVRNSLLCMDSLDCLPLPSFIRNHIRVTA